MKTTSTCSMLLGLAPLLAACPASGAPPGGDGEPARPNILWISAEDISADLGAYGDEYATTPNLDAFAQEGATFEHCYANAGVCAVARSCIITGMYPVAIGSQHMRSDVVPPPEVKCFPEYLRAAGYYTSNRSKTDYNFDAPPSAWDANGRKHGDWAGRAEGQPFFSVINLTVSHESKVRDQRMRSAMADRLGDRRHDPAAVTLPPYIPDAPEARADRAQYYDVLTLLDDQVGQILARLEQDGLADETVVMFWGDHGVGLPRAKRWLYDSGLHVPMLVRWPGVIRPGTHVDELVSFVDYAPTTLAVAGVGVPKHMQGKALYGPNRDEPRRYIYAHRDRMDETYDLIRAVRDKRYKYVRNFMPSRSRGQNLTYMDVGGTMASMRRLHAAGELSGPPAAYFEPTKPVEELYDTQSDPHEIRNAADDPAHAEILVRMRQALETWQTEAGDAGMIPEAVLAEEQRPGGEKARTQPPRVVTEPVDGEPGRVRVTLGSPTPGASVVYGLGGEEPTKRLYSMPFTVDAGTEVTALACRLGYRDSESATAVAGAAGGGGGMNAVLDRPAAAPAVVPPALPGAAADAPRYALGPHSNGRSMTTGEFDAVDNESCDPGFRYELLRGVLIVSPIPNSAHEAIIDELGFMLRAYRRDHPDGAACDGTLPSRYVATFTGRRIADRLIWCGLGRDVDEAGDPPTIAVEVVSEAARDRRRAYLEKRAEYRDAGLAEYWIIDRFARTVTVIEASGAERELGEAGAVETPLLPGFSLTPGDLFREAGRWGG